MFGFPTYLRTTYKKNFLRSVTFQMKYAKENSVLNQKAKLIELLSSTFPNNKEENAVSFQLPPDNKTQIIPKHEGIAGFYFETKDKLKSLHISTTNMVITITGQQYINFEAFWNEFEPKISDILKTSGISEINWLSIRKINLIQLKLLEGEMVYQGISSIFNKALVDQYLILPGKEYLNRGFSNFTLTNDNKNLNLTIGLLPSSQEIKDLILDIDLFCDNEKLKIDEIKNRFGEINQEIFNVFNWSLQDATIETLKQEQ